MWGKWNRRAIDPLLSETSFEREMGSRSALSTSQQGCKTQGRISWSQRASRMTPFLHLCPPPSPAAPPSSPGSPPSSPREEEPKPSAVFSGLSLRPLGSVPYSTLHGHLSFHLSLTALLQGKDHIRCRPVPSAHRRHIWFAKWMDEMVRPCPQP